MRGDGPVERADEQATSVLKSGWERRRLRTVADVRNSNVNKVSVAGEEPVRLCNYTDVFYRSKICTDQAFMSATATRDEIARFGLRVGDVIITKDFEDWQEIGVPTVVTSTADDLVCGYHLTLLRPRPGLDGRFLYWALHAPSARRSLSVAARGITSYGLTLPGLKATELLLPPPEEQAAIVRYLDHATARLDRAVAAKRRVVALLEEQKQAVIHRAVTRGLDETAPTKDSGVPWLGKVPAGWELPPLRRFLRFSKNVVGHEHTKHVLLSLTLRGIIERDMENLEGKFPSDFSTYQTVRPGQFVLCLFDVEETPRTVALSKLSGMITGAYTVADCREPDYAAFLERYLIAMDSRKAFKPMYRGLRNTLPKTTLLSSRVPIPPRDEANAIVRMVEGEANKVDETIATHLNEIALLQEYRTALVAEVVTGQRDVRALAAALPPLADEAPLADQVDDDALSDALLEEADAMAEATA